MENELRKRLVEFAKINKNKPGFTHGIARGFHNGQQVFDLQGNLSVGPGRQFVAAKLFELEDTFFDNVSSGTNLYNHCITHFALGNGGTTMIEGYENLIGPNPCDDDLYSPISMDNVETHLPSPQVGTENSLKPISNENISIIEAADIEECSVKSYVKIIIGVQSNEPTIHEMIKINEAGIYITNYKLLPFPVNKDNVISHLFAHLCFKPNYIERESEFYIEWYILC